jgi:hypothetical protein
MTTRGRSAPPWGARSPIALRAITPRRSTKSVGRGARANRDVARASSAAHWNTASAATPQPTTRCTRAPDPATRNATEKISPGSAQYT